MRMLHRNQIGLIALLLLLACDSSKVHHARSQGDGGLLDTDVTDASEGGDVATDVATDPDPPDMVADAPLPDTSGEFGARRTAIWICNSGFGEDPEGDSDSVVLAESSDGREALRLTATGEPCMFHVEHVDSEGTTTRLGEPGAYLFGALHKFDDQVAACMSLIEHEPAPTQEGADPEGVLLRRRTTAVSAVCAVGGPNGWGVVSEVIPGSLDFGPWVMDLTAGGQDGALTLTYQRDSSLNPFNMTTRGRPAEDGVYHIDFTPQGGGELSVGDAVRAGDLENINLQSPPDPCAEPEVDPDDPRCQTRCGDDRCDSTETCSDTPDAPAPACSGDCGPCTLELDDANDPGYREVRGQWGTSRGRAEYARFTDDGVAAFDFKGLQNGWKRLSVNHPRLPNSAGTALYTVVSGETMVGRVTDDQSAPREGWHTLGDFAVNGDFSVVVSKEGEGRLRADAMRVEVLANPPTIIDDGSFSYAELMGDWSSVGSGYGGNHRRSDGGWARYQLNGPSGYYSVGVYLPALDTPAGPVEYVLSAGEVTLAQFVLDQSGGVDDWVSLGQYVLTGNVLNLAVRGVDGGPVVADAVGFEPVQDPSVIEELLVGVESPFYRETAGWQQVADGRATDEADAAATYTFAGLAAGPYHVVVQYPPAPGNAPDSQYAVSSVGRTLTTFNVDQREVYEEQWRPVGGFFAPGPVVSIRLHRGGAPGRLHAGQVKVISYDCRHCEGHPLP
jgi:hypothetical protein